MADNTTLNLGTGGDVIAADDIGGVKYPIGKLAYGPLDTATLVSKNDALPVGFYTDASDIDTTTVVLAASATYTSPIYDTTLVGPYVSHYVKASHTGTHIFEVSLNGTDFDPIDTDPLGASEIRSEEHYCSARYHRTRFVNDGTLQTSFFHSVVCRHIGTGHEIGIKATQNMVQGDKTHNTSGATAEAFEVIGAIAHAAAPTYTEAAVVMPRITLSGDTAITLDGETVQAAVAGDVAHDGVDSGNPAKLGAKAVSSLEAQTVVAANDRTNLYSDLDGVLVTKPLTTFADILADRVADTAGTSAAFTNHGAGGAGVRNYVSTIAVFNSSATDAFVDLRDGAAGAILFTVPAPKGGGSIITFPVPLRQPTANTALAYDVSAAITTMYISIVGFQSKAG